MIDLIKTQFKSITNKCLERYGSEFESPKDKMQLVFRFANVDQSERELEYVICKEYNIVKEITFLQVLGVKLDFSGKSLYVPSFIKGALIRLSEENNINPKVVRVMLSVDKDGNLTLWLYNDKQYIKQFELDSLFNTEDILEQQQ
jgi:hypothetical protein